MSFYDSWYRTKGRVVCDNKRNATGLACGNLTGFIVNNRIDTLQTVFYDDKLSNCPLSLADASYEFQIPRECQSMCLSAFAFNLSHGGHIVQGDQKSFVLPCRARGGEALRGKTKAFLVSRDNMTAVWLACVASVPVRFKRKENSARESAKNEARGRGKGGKGTLASNHCESQIRPLGVARFSDFDENDNCQKYPIKIWRKEYRRK